MAKLWLKRLIPGTSSYMQGCEIHCDLWVDRGVVFNEINGGGKPRLGGGTPIDISEIV